MNRRELLTGAAVLAGVTQANAFGIGKEGARGGFGHAGAVLGRAGTSAPVLWTPSQLGSALVAWWDANSGVAFGTGSQVASWTDRKGGIVASQGTGANQPTFSATAQNGKPGITASGAQFLNFSAATLPVGTNTSTFAVAGNVTTAGATAAMFGYGTGSAGDSRVVYKNSSNLVTVTNATFNLAMAEAWDTNRFIVWSLSAGSTTTQTSVDGNAPEAIFTTLTPGTTVAGSGKMFQWPSGAFQAAGTLQQILVLNTTMTLQQQRLLEGWESWYDGKAGANLPANHPFKTRAPYLSDVTTFDTGAVRQAVSATQFPNLTINAATIMSVQPVYLPYDMYSVQIVIPNCVGETILTGTLTCTASIENLETGVAQQITFGSGNASGSTTGAYLTSDIVTLSAGKYLGTTHRIRIWGSHTNSTFGGSDAWAGPGDSTVATGAAVADSTMNGGFPANSSAGVGWGAVIVASRHGKRAVCALGDSICKGQGTAGNNRYAPLSGLFVPSLATSMPTANFGIQGDVLSGFVASHAIRLPLINTYFSSVGCNYGINDLGSRTGAQINADTVTANSLITIPVHWSTITFNCSSTDDFATAAPNQVSQVNIAEHEIANNYRRTLPNFIEIADALGFRANCTWRSVGDGSVTQQTTSTTSVWSGVHPTAYGYTLANAVVTASIATFT